MRGRGAGRAVDWRHLEVNEAWQRHAADLTVLYEGQMTDRNEAERLISLGGHHIVFSQGHSTPPRSATGSIDWSKVSRIRILEIEVANG